MKRYIEKYTILSHYVNKFTEWTGIRTIDRYLSKIDAQSLTPYNTGILKISPEVQHMALYDSLVISDPEKAGIDPQRLEAIGNTVQRYIDSGKVPNMVTAIVRKGQLVHFEARGYLDIESRKPVEKDTIFRLYSNSKAVAGVAVMILCEEGRMHLDDPVSKYIPAFKNPLVQAPGTVRKEPVAGPEILPPLVPASREITICDCLRNTTGLATPLRSIHAVAKYYDKAVKESGWDLAEDLDRPPRTTYLDRVTAHAKIPLAFDPGTQFEYHVGYPVIGVIIESVTGKTLEEFYREKIFSPLRMDDTSFYLDEKNIGRFSTCYVPALSKGSWQLTVYDRPETSEKVKGPRTRFAPGGDMGGLLSTVGDYMNFARMLLNQGELDGERILSRKSVEIMTSNNTGSITTPLLKPGFGWGLGVAVYTGTSPEPIVRSPGSFGWGGAAGTTFFVDPKEELAAVCFTQVLHRNMMPENDYQEEFERVVYQALK